MQKWMVDGLIGWGAVAALTIVVSLATEAPYEFIPTVIYALVIGLIIGAPGGIFLGRAHEGWAWPFAGGVSLALIIGVILIVFRLFQK